MIVNIWSVTSSVFGGRFGGRFGVGGEREAT